jgi:hypothetical protein
MNKDRLDKIQEILGGASSQRLRESFFEKKYNSLHLDIIDYCKDISELKYPQKLWHYVNEIPTYNLCKTCNINRTKFLRNWLDGYRPYCSYKCSATNQDTKDKREDTCNEIYGVSNVAKLESTQIKKGITNDEIYGFKCSFQNTDVRKKWSDNLLKNRGIDHISKDENIKKIKEDRCFEKNGIKYLLSSKEFREEIKINNKLKTGFEYIQQTNDYKNINNIKMFNKYEEYFIDSDYYIKDYKNSNFVFLHKQCNKNFTITLNRLLSRIDIEVCLCTECYPISDQKSIKEKELTNWIESLNIEQLTNRSILEGKELDIYIHKHNLAIEFNGLYWHSENFRDKNYHLDKSLQCQEKDIHLMHIWEDEWVYKQEIVKSIILNKLNKIENKIFARKCVVKEVKDSKLVRQFLDTNHIQGYSQSSIKLGLYYNDKLVSLMTFGYRHTNRKKEFELIRFCNRLNTNVIGASSKLFKYFLNNYSKNNILSYSDFRLFDGKMYETLGFEKIHLSKPDYFWCKNLERKHRFTFNKQKLIKDGYDPNKTEVEIMHERGYSRIWGCGQVRWEYKR